MALALYPHVCQDGLQGQGGDRGHQEMSEMAGEGLLGLEWGPGRGHATELERDVLSCFPCIKHLLHVVVSCVE